MISLLALLATNHTILRGKGIYIERFKKKSMFARTLRKAVSKQGDYFVISISF